MKRKMVIDYAGARGQFERRLASTDRVAINSGGMPLVELTDAELKDYEETMQRYDAWMRRLFDMEKATKKWLSRSGEWRDGEFRDVKDRITGPLSPGIE